MALHVPKAPGFAQMLKEGAKVRFVVMLLMSDIISSRGIFWNEHKFFVVTVSCNNFKLIMCCIFVIVLFWFG